MRLYLQDIKKKSFNGDLTMGQNGKVMGNLLKNIKVLRENRLIFIMAKSLSGDAWRS